MKKSETRLQRMLDHARHALEAQPDPRPGLGDHDRPSTRRVALAPGLSPTLVHPIGRRGLPDLVDPSTAELLVRLQAVGRELHRGGVTELLRRVQAHSADRRARLLED